MKLKLLVAATLLAVSTFALPAQAGQYTLKCIGGIDYFTDVYRTAFGGNLSLDDTPEIVSVSCNGKQHDTYTLRGFPGTYVSLDRLHGAITAIKTTIQSGALATTDVANWPPAVKFVNDVLQQIAAAEKTRKAAQAGKSPGMLDQKH
ncbi:MAG: hypothetical protein AAB480_01875 [Patescibacteria group bacterium]